MGSFPEKLLQHQRDLNNGAGGAYSAAFEMALAPALFAGVGLLLDRWLGLFPLATLALFLFGCVGMFVRSWYAYQAKMERLEAELPSSKRPGAGAAGG